MSIEIMMNVTPHETRVAVVENGVLQEVIIERERCRGLVGNIYKGKVSRVLPGMQAAFIDIGLERAAFLHASDIAQGHEEENRTDNINQLLHEGQELPVQVIKDPLGTKGRASPPTLPFRPVFWFLHQMFFTLGFPSRSRMSWNASGSRM